MAEFLHFLAVSASAGTLDSALARSRELLLSGDMMAWFVVLILLRFDVPAFTVWIVNAFRPSVFHGPPASATFVPSVAVLIAGRNPGRNIERTIRSVLDCGYPNIEVIYADDRSTDDSVMWARTLERTARVRVFSSSEHSGKASNLNIALHMARSDLALVLDADAELAYGAIAAMVTYFQDPTVGAVTADIRLRNGYESLLTRIQQIEYALNGSIARLWRAQIGLLPILPGAASMFRIRALRSLSGYDTGLGDDTDMTVRMRKARWRLRYALDAHMFTDEPVTLAALLRQRIRWTRNMVKVRLRKHADLIHPRYGWDNTIVFLDNMLFRVIFPLWACGAIGWGLATNFGERAALFTSLYFFFAFLVMCKVLIANDVAGTPPLRLLYLVPLYLPYRLLIRTVEALVMVREMLRIGLYHPYVPRRIWAQTPHW